MKSNTVAEQVARLTDSQPVRLDPDSSEITATVCAWCPDFNPRDPANYGKSHGMCVTCQQKIEAQRRKSIRTVFAGLLLIGCASVSSAQSLAEIAAGKPLPVVEQEQSEDLAAIARTVPVHEWPVSPNDGVGTSIVKTKGASRVSTKSSSATLAPGEHPEAWWRHEAALLRLQTSKDQLVLDHAQALANITRTAISKMSSAAAAEQYGLFDTLRRESATVAGAAAVVNADDQRRAELEGAARNAHALAGWLR